MALVATIAVLCIRKTEQPRPEGSRAPGILLIGGFSFVVKEKVVLGACTLDLFAVLLGSASILLPMFAKDTWWARPGLSACCARASASAR